jgi:hypothetical protein
MRKLNIVLAGGILLAGVLAGQVFVNAQNTEYQAQSSKLAVVWTSGDADVAYKVCFMYTNAAKTSKWFDEVTLIVWGPSSRILAGDEKLQEEIKKMMDNGVDVKACVACANMYGVADKLRQLGIEVKGMGKPLSEMLKSDWKVLTF